MLKIDHISKDYPTPAGPLSSSELAELVKALDPPPGFDIVTALGPDESVDALAEAGATWLIDGPAPEDTFAAVQARVRLGPPR